MSNYSRFGLIPLPLSMKEKAVNGEFLVDPNTGHIYLKDNNGKVFSKTLELEERINEIEIIRKHSLDNVTFDGTQFSTMTSSTNYTLESPITAIVSEDILEFDKVPFYASPFCKYQLEITYIPNSENEKDLTGRVYLNPLDTGSLEYMVRNLINYSVSGEERTKIFEFSMHNSQIDKEGEAVFALQNVNGVKIKHVRLKKIPINNNERNSLNINALDIASAGNTIYHVDINNSDGSVPYQIYIFKIPVEGIEIDLTKYNLMFGLYSVNILFTYNTNWVDGPNTFTLTTISKDGTETELDYNLKIQDLPDLKQKYVAADNTLNSDIIRIGTMAVYVPMCGLSKIRLKTSNFFVYAYNLSFNYINTALYDHRSI